MNDSGCTHCGGPIPRSETDGFCCGGCRLVHQLIDAEGLERYYALRGPNGEPVAEAKETRDRKWLEPITEQMRAEKGDVARVDLDLQGISCAACVWLIDQLFRKEEGAISCLVDPALGRVSLLVHPQAFGLVRFVSRVESCGYLLGPRRKQSVTESPALLWRMGACIAIAMNAMLLAFSIYAGLSEGPILKLFTGLSFALATASVLVGGSWFVKSAVGALRRGVLHLDLPIALGVVLAYVSSTWAYLAHSLTTYFDTLSVFIALMLVGRFLQQRMIEKNRQRLLQSDETEHLLSRRVQGDEVSLVRCHELVPGDRLLLAPGDVVPVSASAEERTVCSLDWINGESVPRHFEVGDVIPAGAFVTGTRVVTALATETFEKSMLVDLLRAPQRDAREGNQTSLWWQRFARIYVGAVLLLALGALLVGLRMVHDPHLALERVTAVLIITCPCAFGIAAPLAYQIVHARLRRAGLYVRSPSFLDRAAEVRKVVFDKTGTLTTGRLELVDDAPAHALDEADRAILLDLAQRSGHPKSQALVHALGSRGFRPIEVEELSGKGVRATVDGHEYRLGAPGWASDDDANGDVVFGRDGVALATFAMREDLRHDAREEVAALEAMGLPVYLLSGDDPDRVALVAARCGVPTERAVGGADPTEKAAWMTAHDARDTLFVGDGINDGPVVDAAFTSGTPAIDRPFLAARADFYLVTAGVGPVRKAIVLAQRLRAVLRQTLGVALAYNVLTVGLAYAGKMSPLLCAIVMPLSSLSTIFAVVAQLSESRSARREPAPLAEPPAVANQEAPV
ncbi:MAG: heavy metal translocating P-type ATPase metal-binding domain-containing protein [Myxococcales bacterium]|nr:heavy metal translocating P-type ATPase metal-binding domain-containing protein [Myxococcales bacterium]